MSLFDATGSLLGKAENSPTSVPEALVAALGSQEGGLGGLIEILSRRNGSGNLVLDRYR